jgi:EpsI family protein
VSGWRYGLVIATLAATGLVSELRAGARRPPAIPLSDVPFRIDGWTARAEPVDADVLDRARPDEVLSRRYADDQGRVVVVYVGYYTRGATRGQVMAVCGGECQVLTAGTSRIDTADGAWTVNRASIRQGGLVSAVLYWFHLGPRVTHDPFRGKIEQARQALLHRRSDGAVVRITVPVVGTEEQAWAQGKAFARPFLAVLRRHLPR